MSDPNKPYEPQPYPKMVYKDRATYRLVSDEAEHQEATDEGYVDFNDLPEDNPDGLETRSDDWLRGELLRLAAEVIKSRPREELIYGIRFQYQQAEKARLEEEAKAKAEEAFKTEEGDGEPAVDDEDGAVIYGSSEHPDAILIGETYFASAAIVGEAFTRSGLRLDAWNELPPSDRNALIQQTIDQLAEANPNEVLHLLGEDAVTEAPAETNANTAPEVVEEQGEEGAPVEAETEEATEAQEDAVEVVEAVEGEGDVIAALRAELTALGVPWHHKNNEATLRGKLAEAKAA